jgi:hypothetical protein
MNSRTFAPGALSVALTVALKTVVEREKRKPALASSTRNLLEHRVLRRAWTETV